MLTLAPGSSLGAIAATIFRLRFPGKNHGETTGKTTVDWTIVASKGVGEGRAKSGFVAWVQCFCHFAEWFRVTSEAGR